jgi:hypothetical protein
MFESAHVGDVFVVCHGPGSFTTESWRRFMNGMRQRPITTYMPACVGLPGSTSVEREEVFAYLKEKQIRLVCLTDERFIRGIVTAARWVGVDAFAFPWAEVTTAVQKCGITDPAQIVNATTEIARLRRAVEHAKLPQRSSALG